MAQKPPAFILSDRSEGGGRREEGDVKSEIKSVPFASETSFSNGKRGAPVSGRLFNFIDFATSQLLLLADAYAEFIRDRIEFEFERGKVTAAVRGVAIFLFLPIVLQVGASLARETLAGT